MTKMNLLIITLTLFASPGITACGETTTDRAEQSGELTPANTFLNLIEQVKVGMSREEVVAILGPYIRSVTPDGHPPICDSYKYESDGHEKYAHVWYGTNSRVESVTINNSKTCGIV